MRRPLAQQGTSSDTVASFLFMQVDSDRCSPKCYVGSPSGSPRECGILDARVRLCLRPPKPSEVVVLDGRGDGQLAAAAAVNKGRCLCHSQ